MDVLSMSVSRVEEMRKMDRRAIDEYGIVETLLMENAGNASFSAFFRETFGIGKRVAVVCGSGNNGGDGLVVARKFNSMGYEVKVFLCNPPEKFKGTALMNFEIVKKLGISVEYIENTESFSEEIRNYEIIVDAVFGTGLSREVSGKFREVIEAINRGKGYVCSVDIPSGVNGDTGIVMGVAVKADCTVTFGAPKTGNLLYPGYDYCGKLYVTRISFPPEIYEDSSLKVRVVMPEKLPSRFEGGHKGDFGDVLFLAGSKNYYGAPYFSAFSFLKAGGGYSRLATPESVAPHIAGKGNELVIVPLKETKSGSVSKDNLSNLLELSEKVDFVVVGPGLSLNDETQELVRDFVQNLAKPVLVDGDGLTAISKTPEVLLERSAPTILTPHPGEMARIAKTSVEEVIKNRIDLLAETSQKLKSIVVLKGAHTLIGLQDGTVLINLSGNSALATAGTGDVLTGTIAAMYGLGLPIDKSVIAGVFIHGLAGELASDKLGEDGVTAQDVLHSLPVAVKEFRTNYDEIVRDFHGKIYFV